MKPDDGNPISELLCYRLITCVHLVVNSKVGAQPLAYTNVACRTAYTRVPDLQFNAGSVRLKREVLVEICHCLP